MAHWGWESVLSAVLACHPVLASGTQSCSCAPVLQLGLGIEPPMFFLVSVGIFLSELLKQMLMSC